MVFYNVMPDISGYITLSEPNGENRYSTFEIKSDEDKKTCTHTHTHTHTRKQNKPKRLSIVFF